MLHEDPTRCFGVSGSPFVNRTDPKPFISLSRRDNQDQRDGPERDGKKRKAGLDSKEESECIAVRVQGKMHVVAGYSPDLERTRQLSTHLRSRHGSFGAHFGAPEWSMGSEGAIGRSERAEVVDPQVDLAVEIPEVGAPNVDESHHRVVV